MQRTLVAVLLGLTLLVSYAQTFNTEKPVVCADLKSVVKSLEVELGEVPFWHGNDTDTAYVMLVNKHTGTWTILQFNESNACIIGDGINFRAAKLTMAI